MKSTGSKRKWKTCVASSTGATVVAMGIVVRVVLVVLGAMIVMGTVGVRALAVRVLLRAAPAPPGRRKPA